MRERGVPAFGPMKRKDLGKRGRHTEKYEERMDRQSTQDKDRRSTQVTDDPSFPDLLRARLRRPWLDGEERALTGTGGETPEPKGHGRKESKHGTQTQSKKGNTETDTRHQETSPERGRAEREKTEEGRDKERLIETQRETEKTEVETRRERRKRDTRRQVERGKR